MNPEPGNLCFQSLGIPRATCRLQFNSRFKFSDAREMADYLLDLGISHVYASPLFPAGPQSSHGYDVCSFDQINSVLGGNGGFDQFSETLKQLGLGLIVDLVPNHMGTDPSNAWWTDILELGPSSKFAGWFDINWDPDELGREPRVLVPILEALYPAVLEAGKLQLAFNAGRFVLRYYTRDFPLSPRSYPLILDERCIGDASSLEANGVVAACDILSKPSRQGRYTATQLAAFKQLKDLLASWHGRSVSFQQRLEARLKSLNGSPGEPRWFEALHDILQKQHYRVAFWRIGPEELNYRRFFDITELVSLRMELPEVFDATHRLVFSLLKEEKVHGLRIDHPDGLWDPRQYLERLQQRWHAECPSDSLPSLYVLVEKILTGHEPLRPDWPVSGTTGYEFLNLLNGIFVDSPHAERLDHIYRSFTGIGDSFDSLVFACKRLILETSLRGDLHRLARRAGRIAARSRVGQDLTASRMTEALKSLIAAFPVYRTYVGTDQDGVAREDAAVFEQAVEVAGRMQPGFGAEFGEFFRALLLMKLTEAGGGVEACRHFVMAIQQVTSPVMAKGVEDTAFYRFNRLVSLNEVGGEPGRFGIGLERFHEANRERAERWPHSMLATATHDTKRGEDVRARINVISELPDEWERALTAWARINARFKSVVDGQPAPDANDEYLFYQTLVGAWPGKWDEQFVGRAQSYMSKAVKEAKRHTSWTDPNGPYEEAVNRFVEGVLGSEPFLESFLPFQRKVAFFGLFNSLAQVLVRCTAPGVPDLYQGCELWDLSLVDPDNRRPVDFGLRRRMLNELRERVSGGMALPALLSELLRERADGRVKLYVTWRALEFRRQHADLFARYVPVRASGPKAEHVCAFMRGGPEGCVLTAVPRLVARLTGGRETMPQGEASWGDTWLELPDAMRVRELGDVISGQTLQSDAEGRVGLSAVFRHFPVALLHS